MPKGDCWERLRVDAGASAAEVRAAYRRRVRELHPDHGGGGDGAVMRALQDARAEALAAIGRRPWGRARGAAADGASPADRLLATLALAVLAAIAAAAAW